MVDPCTRCCRFFSPCVGQAIGELRKTAIQQLSLKKKPGKFLIPSGQIPDTKRANSWYQLLIGHRERSNVEKQGQNCYLKSQAGMYLNFRAIAGGALIGQNHRNRHVTCGNEEFHSGFVGGSSVNVGLANPFRYRMKTRKIMKRASPIPEIKI